MKKPRHLSKDERDIWDRVARSATPLNPPTVRKPDATPPPRKAAKPPRVEDPLPDFRVGSRADAARPHDTLGPLSDRLRAKPVSMDAKNFGRMSRGKLKPEARIDLHGMTLAEAHPELVRFMLHAVDRGRRLVLVITGKGQRVEDHSPVPQRRGILRQHVPQWLAVPPLSTHILEVRPAHQRHGGEGAYYVYLRRNR
ncbi:MAG: Smr/MutS family protein [Loktanella sp.]|nr:Smr/MutS family protein [Loktanella sp.]